ncbi:ribosome-associated translation inhibitor RaiA [bacterium]|nr:ribosome-associated translation inhibitor RaiA [bacterium]
MELRITGRHFDLTQEIKNYAETTVLGLNRYSEKILDTHLVLVVEKRRKKAELTLGVYGQQLVSHAETDDLYVSIDEVVDKMQRQLKKYNEKFKEHRGLSDEEKKIFAEKITEELLEGQDQIR